MKQILTILLLFAVSVFAQSKSLELNSGADTDEILYEYSDPTWVTGTEWTMEVWVKFDDFNNNWGETHIIRLGAQLYIKVTSGVPNLYANAIGGYWAQPILTDTWYHIAYVRTATTTKVYLDGTEVLSGGADAGSATMLQVGAYNAGADLADSHLSGNIDEVRLWNDARTVTEINDNKDRELVGDESDLLIYYNFNSESGTTITDQAGGDDDGTLLTADSDNWSTDTPGPLPVELTSFTASAVDGSVLLNWETATEVNNYGFDVESSNDGENFSVIGFVEGHGNSNSPKQYSFVATDGATYYRLKQLDTDGKFEYSDVEEVEGNLSYKLSQNHPNPFNPSTVIRYEIGDTRFVSLKVFNTLGQEVATLVNKEQNAGKYQVDFNAISITSGIYFYKLETSEFSKTMKMLLLR